MKAYYILDNENKVIAIFKNEEYARDYLEHMIIEEDNCKIGIIPESIFRFDEYDAKYHTMRDSSLNKKQHMQCRRFRCYDIEDDSGYCFLTDQIIQGHDRACGMIERRE